MFGSQCRFPQGHATFEEVDCPCILAHAPQVLPDHPAQTCFDSRVKVVTLVQFGRGAVEQLAQRGVLGENRALPTAAESVLPFHAGQRQEVVGHERGDGLRVLAFGGLILASRALRQGCLLCPGCLAQGLELGEPFSLRTRPLGHPCPIGDDQPPARAHNSGQECEQEQGCRHHRAAVSPHEFLEPIAGAGLPRQHGLVVQESLDVSGQAAGGFVAAVALLGQGLHHDPVELSFQEFAELRRVGVPVGRDGRPRVG